MHSGCNVFTFCSRPSTWNKQCVCHMGYLPVSQTKPFPATCLNIIHRNRILAASHWTKKADLNSQHSGKGTGSDQWYGPDKIMTLHYSFYGNSKALYRRTVITGTCSHVCFTKSAFTIPYKQTTLHNNSREKLTPLAKLHSAQDWARVEKQNHDTLF